MLITERKPLDEVLAMVEGSKSVFLAVCGGCPEACETTAPAEVEAFVKDLKDNGKTVVSQVEIDFLCNKALIALRLGRHMEALQKADAVFVLSCGVGVQATAAMVGKPCYPALNTIAAGGVQGLWRGDERCGECGDCVLDRTGGICPITGCAKTLLNGTCGGSDKGICEVSPERPCGWYLIYERLRELGQLDKLLAPVKPKAWGKFEAPPEMRGTILWALEAEEPAPEEQEVTQ